MFAKAKDFIIDKAFGLAFMRYDGNSSGMLDKNQLTSMINDAFMLLKIQRQISWIETAVLLKMFDSDDNEQIDKEQARQAFRNALAKFGGIGGIAKFAGFNKTSSGLPMEGSDEPDYSHIPKDQQDEEYMAQGKISGKLDMLPDEIDESALAKLPPVGQNLKPQDLQKAQVEEAKKQSTHQIESHQHNQQHQGQNHPQGHANQGHKTQQTNPSPQQQEQGGFFL